MSVTRLAPCKINLLLNILGKREDGFHDLETVMIPVPLVDRLELDTSAAPGITLTCDSDALPTDGRNLVHRAATAFLKRAGISSGVQIHLEKKIPMEAGLGGGSSDAAHTLAGLNQLLGQPLSLGQLTELAASLGSDVPFFLSNQPAIATGRGERLQLLDPLEVLKPIWLFLAHPGFGVSTAWAYQQLDSFPQARTGKPGKGVELVSRLQRGDLRESVIGFHNSLEVPVHAKYPLLALFQERLRRMPEVVATLMCGSGSTTFAMTCDEPAARRVETSFRQHFGDHLWTAIVPLTGSPASLN
jgi:4-diphosphocytidyl-2-C-methyl-D-erythritol kinase